jgi:hypothetical protein
VTRIDLLRAKLKSAERRLEIALGKISGDPEARQEVDDARSALRAVRADIARIEARMAAE